MRAFRYRPRTEYPGTPKSLLMGRGAIAVQLGELTQKSVSCSHKSVRRCGTHGCLHRARIWFGRGLCFQFRDFLCQNCCGLADPLKIRADKKAKMSQADIRSASLEQLSSDFLLQRLDGARERRLRDAATFCCTGKALLLAECDKVERLGAFSPAYLFIDSPALLPLRRKAMRSQRQAQKRKI